MKKFAYNSKVKLREDYSINYRKGDIGTIVSYNLTSIKDYDGFRACLVKFENQEPIPIPQRILEEI